MEPQKGDWRMTVRRIHDADELRTIQQYKYQVLFEHIENLTHSSLEFVPVKWREEYIVPYLKMIKSWDATDVMSGHLKYIKKLNDGLYEFCVTEDTGE